MAGLKNSEEVSKYFIQMVCSWPHTFKVVLFFLNLIYVSVYYRLLHLLKPHSLTSENLRICISKIKTKNNCICIVNRSILSSKEVHEVLLFKDSY